MKSMNFRLLLLIASFTLFFESGKANFHVWEDPILKVKKKINFDNGDLLIEAKPNKYVLVSKIKLHKDFNKNDFIGNKVVLFKDGNVSYFLFTDLNVLYLLDEEHKLLNRFYFSDLPEESLFNIHMSDIQYLILVIFLSVFFVFVFFVIFKKGIIFYAEVRRPIRKPMYFDEFLKLILDSGPNYLCSTLTLNEILHIEKKSYEIQRQLRSKFIRNINKFILDQYRIKNAVIRVSASEDRRFVYYQITQATYFKLKSFINMGK
ncbi:hypothetical protein V7S79_00180 [Aquirufa sp. ROCK-SH2]